MTRKFSGSAILVVTCVAALALVVLSTPAYAQMGSIQGRVVDESGNPVPDAEVTLDYTGDMPYHFTVKTNKKGEWIRAGLFSVGRWTVTAKKGKAAGFLTNVEVPLNSAKTLDDIVITEGAVAPTGDVSVSEAEARNKQTNELKKIFADVDAAVTAKDYDTAIAKLNEANEKVPSCAPCQVQLGDVYMKQDAPDKAEAAYKQAISFDANSADAYDGLTVLYNQQRKFDDAAAASKKAAELKGASGGGDDATSLYNSGAILVNQGKMAEAQTQFEKAIQADPTMAEAHYQLAMTLINQGKIPDAIKALQQYLSLNPTGQNAQQAKDILPQLQKMQ